MNEVWDEISPYINLKLLIRSGKLIRNMRKTIADGSKTFKEVISRAGNIEQGLLKTDNVTHAISYVDNIGVMYTTKKQKSNDTLLIKDNITFAYVQGFGDNFIINKNMIKNNDLSKLLYRRGNIDAVYANLSILKMHDPMIIFNDKNKQFLKKLESKDIEKSKEFLTKCGGIENVYKAFEYSEFRNKILMNSQKFLYELSNSDPSLRHKKYMEWKEVHNILNTLEKEKQLDHELATIKNAIEKMII